MFDERLAPELRKQLLKAARAAGKPPVRSWLAIRMIDDGDIDAMLDTAADQSGETVPAGIYGGAATLAIGDGKFIEWLTKFLESPLGKLLLDLLLGLI